MSILDNTKQDKKIQEIKEREEESFVERIAAKFNLPYIDLSKTTIETDALSVLTEEEARKALVAGFKLKGKDFYIAVKSPKLPETIKIIEKLKKEYNVGVHLTSMRSLEKAWRRYADVSKTKNTAGGLLDIDEENIKRISETIKVNSDIKEQFLNVLHSNSLRKTSSLLEIIFGSAITTKSSDIHIEAQEDKVRMRFRQDGVLQDIVDFDHESYAKLLSRIKLLSGMKLTKSHNAQDGRFTINFDGREIEVRVSVIPSAYGESFVMRILDPRGINVGIEGLGIEPKLFEILMKEIKKPNGMILTTGPTGSGKTTTLYSFLKKVYSPEVKILTIEDPIEYHLEGISQTQIDRDKNYTFLSGLRAALRQDPDIIMIGEIRDSETAKIAVNASLTGHLVLSTLHTNGAAGVIPRLLDLGVSPQILAAALSVSIAQRLVRKVCQHCKYEVEPTKEQEETIRNILKEAEKNNKKISDYGMSVDQKITLTEGKGCEMCNGTGYKGRIGIFEAIITDELIEELLNKKPSEQEVRNVAKKQGLLNMREDGVIKILNGTTSFSEVQSVIDLDIKNITHEDLHENIHKEEIEETEEQPEKVSLINEIKESKWDETNKREDDLYSVEIQLLIEYLKRLEYEQMIDPEIDASQKIALLQNTILDLLRDKQAERIFGKKNSVNKKFKVLADDLERLYIEQKNNPKADISSKIRLLREEIENHVGKSVSQK